MRIAALIVALAVTTLAPVAASAGPGEAQLAQDRIDRAAKVYTSVLARWKAGTTTLDQVAAWSVRWLTAQREQPLKGGKLKAAVTAGLADHLQRMKDLATAVTDAVGKGSAPAIDAEAAGYFVAEAELWAARGK